MTSKYGQWFRVAKTDVRWLAKSPQNRTSRCDRRWAHVVRPNEPRLMVDSGEGPVRKRGRGKRHEYLCRECAKQFFDTKPPAPVDEMQEKMF